MKTLHKLDPDPGSAFKKAIGFGSALKKQQDPDQQKMNAVPQPWSAPNFLAPGPIKA